MIRDLAWFVLGFGSCALIWIAWHVGFIKPKLDELKDWIEADIEAKVQRMEGKP